MDTHDSSSKLVLMATNLTTFLEEKGEDFDEVKSSYAALYCRATKVDVALKEEKKAHSKGMQTSYNVLALLDEKLNEIADKGIMGVTFMNVVDQIKVFFIGCPSPP